MIKQGISILFKHSFNPKVSKKLFQPRILLKHCKLFTEKKQQPNQQNKQTLTTPETQKKKLAQIQFDELIEMRTEDSFLAAEKKVQLQQKKVQTNHLMLKEMADKMEYFQKHAEEIKQKQLKLIENIQEQEKQLKRVKLRADKQVDDSKKYSITKLAKELLEAADCINRCKNQATKEYPDSKDPFVQSIIETQNKLVDVLKSFEIEEFDPTGKEFDPNTQESLLQIPCMPGFTPNTVATTMRTGYTIQGRLLRSARVGIFQ